MKEYLINKGRGVTLTEGTIPGAAMISPYMLRDSIKDTADLDKVLCHGDSYYSVMSEPLHEDLNEQLPYKRREIELILGAGRPITLADIIHEVCKAEASRFARNNVNLMMHGAFLFTKVEGLGIPKLRPTPNPSLCQFFLKPKMEKIRITKIVYEPEVWHEGTLWRSVYSAHLVFEDIP